MEIFLIGDFTSFSSDCLGTKEFDAWLELNRIDFTLLDDHLIMSALACNFTSLNWLFTD